VLEHGYVQVLEHGYVVQLQDEWELVGLCTEQDTKPLGGSQRGVQCSPDEICRQDSGLRGNVSWPSLALHLMA